MIGQHSSCLFDIFHALINSATFLTKIHDGSDIFRCYHDLRLYHRFFHIFNFCRIRHIGRICQVNHFPVCLMDLINNTRCSCYKIQIIFSLKTLLNDLQMKQS